MADDYPKQLLKRRCSRHTGLVLALMFSLLLPLMAGVNAQTGPLMVTITGVESDAFPRVTIVTAVSDQNGPVDALAGSDFKIFEAGTEVAASTVAVEATSLPELRLVLALDVSVPNADDLAAVKAAAKIFVQALGPGDRVALVSFADQVYLEHDFTNNQTELQAVIDDLRPDISYTASHAALTEAVALLGEQTTGRKAAIMITDSRNNTGPTPIDATIQQAQAGAIPLYVVGFGNKIQGDPLQDEVGSTGGQYVPLAGADQVQGALLELEPLMRQGYRITFESKLQADDTEQDVAVEVTHAGQTAQALAGFTAKSGQVTVMVRGLPAVNIVTDTVQLTAEITAPAPEATLTYRLDDQQLTTLFEPPYAYTWDTTTALPGPHTLTASAVDSAGNTGQTAIDLTVAGPIYVTIPLTQTEIEVGEQIPIPARAEIMTGTFLINVDFLIDGQLKASLDTPPYRYPLDTGDLAAGSHQIAVQIRDSLGQTAAASTTLQIVQPPPEAAWAYWLRTRLNQDRPTFARGLAFATKILVVLAALLALVGGSIAAVLVLKTVARTHRRQSRQRLELEIANVGNIHSHYLLQTAGGAGVLKFQFMFQNARLPLRTLPQTQPAGGTMAAPAATPAFAGTRGQAPAAGSVATSTPTRSGSQPGVRSAVETAKSTGAGAGGCMMAIADIFRTLGQLLPGPLGRSARSFSQTLSAGHGAVRRTTYVPQRAARTAGQLRRQVGGLAPAGSTGSGPAKQTRARDATDVVRIQTGPVEPAAASYSAAAAPVAPATTATGPWGGEPPPPRNGDVADGWAETPVVAPSQALTIDLVVDPVDPYRKQACPFTVNSKSVEQPESTLVSEAGLIELGGISWFRRYLPIVAVSLLWLILFVGVVYLTWWRLTGFDYFGWLIIL